MKCFHRWYVEIIEGLYVGALMSVRSCFNTSIFPVTIGLHQGSKIIPCLFILIMDELTSPAMYQGILLFVDDIDIDWWKENNIKYYIRIMEENFRG